ncbi:hypothetical protein Tco_1173821 [Tanacetum coccineum]
MLQVAFCLLEDLTAFYFNTSLRFASRPHCILLQDFTVFCFKTSLRFASSYHCVLLQHHCVLLKTSMAFCLKNILRFDKKLLWQNFIHHCVLLQHHCVLLKTSIAFCLKTILHFDKKLLWQNFILHCVLSRLLHCVLPKFLFKDFIKSIDQGPFELGTTRDALGTTSEGGVLLGLERPRTYEDLSYSEKKRYDADVRATNIVLQGLPKDIYKLINDNIEAKEIWDNVKMLLASSELTKEDRESQLYDEFERFKMLPGENNNEYYVRFHKLVNDIRNIRMIMPNIQLNKGLKETNHEQLYAYLKQHEKHAAQDQLIIERITPSTNDQLAFVSTNQNQRYFARGNGGAQNKAGNANAGQGKPIKCYNYNRVGHITRNCTQPKRPHNSNYFKDKMLLMQAHENGAVLDEEELLFLAGEQGNTFDVDVNNQPVQDLALNEDNIFQADKCDTFDLDVDDESTAQSIFMANLSSVGSANPQAGIPATLSHRKRSLHWLRPRILGEEFFILDLRAFVSFLNGVERVMGFCQESVRDSFLCWEKARISPRSQVEKSWGKESANESDSEEFMNVFMRIGFGSTIKLVSFDEGQVVTFNSKFICGFKNSDCGTGSRSDNTVGTHMGSSSIGSLRFRVSSGLGNGLTSLELEARVCNPMGEIAWGRSAAHKINYAAYLVIKCEDRKCGAQSFPDEEEVEVDAISLATKPPSIVDWKIIKEGKLSYYQIIRADGNSKSYSSMIQILKSFDMEDLETLWSLVKAKHGSTRPEKGYERVLWGDLRTMFEHNIEDTVSRHASLYAGRKEISPYTSYNHCSRNNEVFGSILLVIMNLSMKKLEILKINIKFRGGLLGLKDFMMFLKLLPLRVNATGTKLQLLTELQLLKDYNYLKIKTAQRKDKDCLCDMYEIFL